jgi:hypothetical protein
VRLRSTVHFSTLFSTTRLTKEGVLIRRVLLRLARPIERKHAWFELLRTIRFVLIDFMLFCFSFIHTLHDFTTPGRLLVNLDQSYPLQF